MSINESILDSSFLHRIEKMAITTKRLKKGLYTGKRQSNHQGSSIEFSDYRSYYPGDDFRQIDWNVFGRLEKLFLKRYFDEQEMHISIYIDCSKSMAFGSPNKFTKSIQIAAALGYLSLYHYDKVSVYGFDNQIIETIRGLSGKGKAHPLFHFLQSLNIKNEGSLNQALSTGKAIHGKPGVSIIISDFLFEDGYEKGISFVQSTNQEMILVQVLSRDEMNPLLEGDLKIIDSETRINKEVSMSPFLLNEYRNLFKRYEKNLEEFAHRRGISLIQIDAETEIEHIIFQMFKKTGLIR